MHYVGTQPFDGLEKFGGRHYTDSNETTTFRFMQSERDQDQDSKKHQSHSKPTAPMNFSPIPYDDQRAQDASDFKTPKVLPAGGGTRF